MIPDRDTMVPTFWRRFYLRHVILLAASGVSLLLLFHLTRLDLLLEDAWHAPAGTAWPLRESWWTGTLVHQWLRYILIAAALACLASAWTQRHAANALRWRFVAAATVGVPLVVALSKRMSPMHCPWDVDRYGGTAPYLDLYASLSAQVLAPGHCFPGGFVSTGSWLLAFALLRYPERPRASLWIGLAAATLGLGLGVVQQLRGAHFFSHTLWTLWLSWAIVLALHAALGAWREPAAGPLIRDGEPA